MSEVIYLLGIAKWAKVRKPDPKYNKYGLDLYLSDGSWEAFKKSGIQVKVREDSDGKFVKLSRPESKIIKEEVQKLGPPKVLIRRRDEDGNVTEGYDTFDGDIGNGSLVSCKVQYYPTRNGVGHTLDAVAVENLVEYKKASDDFEMPF